jgi:hypothetical protein
VREESEDLSFILKDLHTLAYPRGLALYRLRAVAIILSGSSYRGFHLNSGLIFSEEETNLDKSPNLLADSTAGIEHPVIFRAIEIISRTEYSD